MSIRSVVSNVVQSRPEMLAVAREHLACVFVRTRDLYIRVYTHTRIRMYIHARAWKTRIDSLFENFLDCDSNDCHLFAHFSSSSFPLVCPIHSSAGCHKLAFYDAAEGTMGFALNSVEEE